jgi:hypothetical protein
VSCKGHVSALLGVSEGTGRRCAPATAISSLAVGSWIRAVFRPSRSGKVKDFARRRGSAMAVAPQVVGTMCRRHIRGFARSRGSNTSIRDICPGSSGPVWGERQRGDSLGAAVAGRRSRPGRLLQRAINDIVTDLAQVWAASSSNISRARRPSSARPLRVRAHWLSSVRSACVSPIVLFISSIVLPVCPLRTTGSLSVDVAARHYEGHTLKHRHVVERARIHGDHIGRFA